MTNLQSGRPVKLGVGANFLGTVDHVGDKPRESSQGLTDWLPFKRLALPKDYIGGRVSFVYNFVPDAGRRSEWAQMAAHINELEHVVFFGDADDGDEGRVLVPRIKIVDSEEVLVPSTVWFYRVEDEVGDGWVRSLYWSIVEECFKMVPVVANPQQRSFGSLATGTAHEFVEHVVEGGAEVMHRVTYGEPDDIGEGINLKDHRFTPGLLVRMGSDTTVIAFEEDVDSGFKLLDMLIGPFDL